MLGAYKKWSETPPKTLKTLVLHKKRHTRVANLAHKTPAQLQNSCLTSCWTYRSGESERYRHKTSGRQWTYPAAVRIVGVCFLLRRRHCRPQIRHLGQGHSLCPGPWATDRLRPDSGPGPRRQRVPTALLSAGPCEAWSLPQPMSASESVAAPPWIPRPSLAQRATERWLTLAWSA